MHSIRAWLSRQSRPTRFGIGAVIMALVTIVLELILSDGPLSRHTAPIMGGAMALGAMVAWRPARID